MWRTTGAAHEGIGPIFSRSIFSDSSEDADGERPRGLGSRSERSRRDASLGPFGSTKRPILATVFLAFGSTRGHIFNDSIFSVRIDEASYF